MKSLRKHLPNILSSAMATGVLAGIIAFSISPDFSDFTLAACASAALVFIAIADYSSRPQHPLKLGGEDLKRATHNYAARQVVAVRVEPSRVSELTETR